ncbi:MULTISPECIES: histidine kinase [unclassified Nonomuraea]|uniref:HAMP domain-containing sensor histidine kinase n=1 Tax=unclassified Nonomuraea TaxID=2593643 RepID=UPI00340E8A71
MKDAVATAPEPPGRTPAQALFRRLFVINALVFAAGTFVLALSPATVSSPVLLTEIPVLLIGLALILAANAFLVRASLAPLTSLTALMRRVDLLHTHDRLPAGNRDLRSVTDTFNQMLDRLEEERSVASAQALAAQEAERGRIARELHDEIGQSLTVALLALKRVRDRAPAELADELGHAQEAIRTSLDEVRQVAHRLRPGVLEDLGLTSALTALATDLSQTGTVEVTRRLAPGLPPLTSEVELVLYRIAQESLTNVARHAQATRATLTLTPDDGDLVLRVTDDGRGGIGEPGAGIRGMHERALLIGARLSVHSPPGGGTEIVLTVPGAAKENAR